MSFGTQSRVVVRMVRRSGLSRLVNEPEFGQQHVRAVTLVANHKSRRLKMRRNDPLPQFEVHQQSFLLASKPSPLRGVACRADSRSDAKVA